MPFVVYFGHSQNTFGSNLEKRLLNSIKRKLDSMLGNHVEYEIINPSDQYYQERKTEWKKNTGNDISYFSSIILPKCNGGIFLPFGDGMWNCYLYDEAIHLYTAMKFVWTIDKKGVIKKPKFLSFKEKIALSEEETKKRIKRRGYT